MNENHTSVVMDALREHIAPEHVAPVYEALADVSDECIGELLALPMKKKSAALLLNIFLGAFGAGRFYMRDFLIAGLRIAATVAVFFLAFVPILGYVASASSFVWYIADCILIYRRVRTDNFETVMGFLKLNKIRSARELPCVSA